MCHHRVAVAVADENSVRCAAIAAIDSVGRSLDLHVAPIDSPDDAVAQLLIILDDVRWRVKHDAISLVVGCGAPRVAALMSTAVSQYGGGVEFRWLDTPLLSLNESQAIARQMGISSADWQALQSAEIADDLLMPRKSVKTIFEAEDDLVFSGNRRRRGFYSTVLFRVTKSESHRVLKAEVTSTTRNDRNAVTLVYPRRVNGVWFTTPVLQGLAAQWSAIRRSLSLMSDIADILRLTTPQSLVLIDELCRGTSTAMPSLSRLASSLKLSLPS
ncbi:hypothetical protein P43SY_005746 [Pythium insidiosum]|uniref:Uncharacterized protein n=1 Tax=Pythium insidiosum TaxID=114742 RepID=A0AAD5M9R3_PYTIN|nr:hypothetical protein P43SY_005746 [Pythium insidiosum]